MRHGKSGNRLSRNQSLRKATMRDMAISVLTQERIMTTSAKAKEARKLIDQLITLGKKDTLAARRKAFSILCDHNLVSTLFKETAPRFKSRAGGYTRIIPYMQRAGDNAELAFLELTEKTRTIITGLKKTKGAKDAVVDAETKPVAEKPHHSAADVKTATKTTTKPTAKKMFQRKTGSE